MKNAEKFLAQQECNDFFLSFYSILRELKKWEKW